MNRVLNFLSQHKWFCLLSGLIYYIATVVFHKPVARFSLKIEKNMTYASYNLSWGLFAVIGLGLALLVILVRIFRNRDKTFNILFTMLTFGLIGASHVVVLAVNLEYIHMIQFSLLVFPLFALTASFRDTVFWVGILGVGDELYQYYVAWWPHQSYYDFNDVSLDIIGGLFMVFLIYLWFKPEKLYAFRRYRKIKWLKSPVFITAASIIILILAANITGLLRFYPSSEGEPDSGALILLSKNPPESHFWSVFEKGKSYHIQGATEWMMFLLLVTSVYSLLDWRLRRIRGDLTSQTLIGG